MVYPLFVLIELVDDEVGILLGCSCEYDELIVSRHQAQEVDCVRSDCED